MAIGDDLMVMLGLVPARDRAGIARGTMADEAKASAAVNGNAEGSALTMQGMRPPAVTVPPRMGDVQLPDDVATDYASGKPRAPGAPSVIPQVMPPPAPQERVVATGPAAAPGAEVTRNSDIILRAIEKQAQARRLQQIIGSIGMIANGAFNRNPDSQARTGASLAGMAGGGGGGDGDIKTLSEILAMRDAETSRIKTVPELQRMFGWSKDRAEAAFDSGEYKKWIDPTNIAKLEGDKRDARTRMDLMKPEVVEALAKRLGQPKEVIEAGIRSGKIGPKELTDIEKDQASTGKIGAETVEQRRATGEAQKADTAYAFYKDNPDAFARLHGIDTDEARRIVGDRKAYDKYQDTSGPTSYAGEAEYHNYERAERAAGRVPISRLEWKSIRPGAETLAEHRAKKEVEAEIAAGKAAEEGYFKENKTARDAYERLTTTRRMQQDLHDPGMITGAGKFSQLELDGRKLLAKAFGKPDMDVSNTQLYNAFRNQVAIDISKDLKGPTTERDMAILQNAAGGNEMSAEDLRRIVILQDINDQRHIQSKRQQAEGFRESDPKRHKAMLSGVPEYPPPNKLIREDMASRPDLVRRVQEKDPDTVQSFPQYDSQGQPVMGKDGKQKVLKATIRDYAESQWGPGGYEYIRKQAKKD